MATKPAPAAQPVAPDPAPAAPKPAVIRPRPPVRFHTIIHALPAIGLVAGFLMMIFKAVPKDNHDYVVAIIGGLLGYLTHAAQAAVSKKAGGGVA